MCKEILRLPGFFCYEHRVVVGEERQGLRRKQRRPQTPSLITSASLSYVCVKADYNKTGTVGASPPPPKYNLTDRLLDMGLLTSLEVEIKV